MKYHSDIRDYSLFKCTQRVYSYGHIDANVSNLFQQFYFRLVFMRKDMCHTHALTYTHEIIYNFM